MTSWLRWLSGWSGFFAGPATVVRASVVGVPVRRLRFGVPSVRVRRVDRVVVRAGGVVGVERGRLVGGPAQQEREDGGQDQEGGEGGQDHPADDGAAERGVLLAP